MSTKNKHYPESSPKPDLPALEEAVLEIWDQEDTFARSVAQRAGAKEFVFYDGPPFGNGLPHYGHIFQSYSKDAAGRYQTMRGKHVARRWGWDCHGLPPELKTEKDLGLLGKKAIREYGVEKFVEKCRQDVTAFVRDWKSIIRRAGRWADMDGAYKTMDTPYTESVMWAFKTLYEKGLVYEDFRVLPYSWAAETVLSNFEVNLNYKERRDPAITVRFRLENGLDALAWTTTPWTLPSNMFLCVAPEAEYSVLELGTGERVVLATNRVAAYARELGQYKLCEIKLGRELAGLRYAPLFDYFAGKAPKGAWQVLCGAHVSDSDGTGIVHTAPGFGEDDFAITKANFPDFPLIRPIDEEGRFTAPADDFAGMRALDANEPVMERLKSLGALFKKDQIVHQYPYCWRTDQPLIYMAMPSWFVRVGELKKRLLDENQRIEWIPGHIKDGRFGKWLDGARDWSISRSRFWGAPIPVWRSPDGEEIVAGSIAELEELCGRKISDLHRPYADVSFERGGKTFRRVEDVFDCWFESGAMPFASLHYPFENKEAFRDAFPADFIGEGLDQTRGWFYTLAVLGAALFDKIPYKTCACTGLIFDEKGQKLSKKLQNYSSPSAFFDKYGSDAFRWLLLSSPLLKGETARVSKYGEEVAKAARRSVLPLWNAYHFFTLYANADGILAEPRRDSKDPLDRYILAKISELADFAAAACDRYDFAAACSEIEKFLDALNNWHIRLSRERFWGTSADKASQQAAFDTLFCVLSDLTRLAAPLMPFTAEHIHRALTGKSPHLADWPDAEERDGELAADMDMARKICAAVKRLRERNGISNRQPLQSLTLIGEKAKRAAPYFDIIKREANVKSIDLLLESDGAAPAFSKKLYIFTPKAGKRLGARLALVQKLSAEEAVKELLPDEYEFRLEKLAGPAETGGHGSGAKGKGGKGSGTTGKGGHSAEETGGPGSGADGTDADLTDDSSTIVRLDIRITPELRHEGLTRDFIRAVQEERKRLGLDVSDRIRLYYSGIDLGGRADEAASVLLAQEMRQGEGSARVPGTDISFKVEKL
ncbi:MAG: isoleucine--tRNA ligase [Rickettsiales bacterium]|jgi:isoleucyl-tRNA synthetase|nr:isoleucine--tRNA ligase [Rickettsiales bacterium]